MNHKIINWLIVIPFCILACTKESNSSQQPKAVVEAFLQPGKPALVKVTKEILTNSVNTGTRIINGLNITITGNGNRYTLTQNAFGEYESASIQVIAGQQYELKFTYNDKVVTGTTTVPDKPVNFTCSPASITVPNFSGGPGGGIPSFPEPVKAKWNNTIGAYHYIAIKSVDPTASEISNNNPGGGGFTNTPDQGSSRDINFTEFKYYGINALILYRIQPEFAALYNSAGSNSQNLTTIPTNLVNALGVFTAVNAADTVFVSVKE
jgi:Domain of unknown function (DUF4249)